MHHIDNLVRFFPVISTDPIAQFVDIPIHDFRNKQGILIMKDGLFVTCRVPFSLNVVFVREEGQKLILHNTIDNIHRFIQF